MLPQVSNNVIPMNFSPRIVSFCNAEYIPVAKNWLLALHKIKLAQRATIVSLDAATRDAFPPEHILHWPIPVVDLKLSDLWSHRLKVLHYLVSLGESIIHSDADAVWLSDPRPDLEACATDVVFSQGTVWPPDVHQRHGLVLCCGFFFISPGPRSLRFLDHVISRLDQDQDDQAAVNRFIADRIEAWEIHDSYQIPFNDTYFTASRAPIYPKIPADDKLGLSVSILPHHAYPRLLKKTLSHTVVAHPLAGKSVSDKMACLDALGLWML